MTTPQTTVHKTPRKPRRPAIRPVTDLELDQMCRESRTGYYDSLETYLPDWRHEITIAGKLGGVRIA